MSESRAKTKFSRVIQTVLSGRKLKEFDAEKIREEDSESGTAAGLIDDGLKYRYELRNKRHPFFAKD